MALWLNRAGSHGEFEKRFLEDSRIYLTWEGLKHNLSTRATKDALRALLHEVYNYSEGAMRNYSAQIWAFYQKMQVGDWVVLPSASSRRFILQRLPVTTPLMTRQRTHITTIGQ